MSGTIKRWFACGALATCFLAAGIMAGCEKPAPEEETVQEESTEKKDTENAETENTGEADDEEQTYIYIGIDETGYKAYEVEIDGELTPEKLIDKISELTDWNLTLADEVTTGKGGMTVNFSSESALKQGPPETQKEEFLTHDVYSFDNVVLSSITETLQQNYILPPGDPNSLDVYFALEEEPIPVDSSYVPLDEPWTSNHFIEGGQQ